jgi:hypothetical protein
MIELEKKKQNEKNTRHRLCVEDFKKNHRLCVGDFKKNIFRSSILKNNIIYII